MATKSTIVQWYIKKPIEVRAIQFNLNQLILK